MASLTAKSIQPYFETKTKTCPWRWYYNLQRQRKLRNGRQDVPNNHRGYMLPTVNTAASITMARIPIQG